MKIKSKKLFRIACLCVSARRQVVSPNPAQNGPSSFNPAMAGPLVFTVFVSNLAKLCLPAAGRDCDGFLNKLLENYIINYLIY